MPKRIKIKASEVNTVFGKCLILENIKDHAIAAPKPINDDFDTIINKDFKKVTTSKLDELGR